MDKIRFASRRPPAVLWPRARPRAHRFEGGLSQDLHLVHHMWGPGFELWVNIAPQPHQREASACIPVRSEWVAVSPLAAGEEQTKPGNEGVLSCMPMAEGGGGDVHAG